MSMTSLQVRQSSDSALNKYYDYQFNPNCPFLSGDNSDTVPPESISNSEVKRISGDGSVGFPHARVAHRQTPN